MTREEAINHIELVFNQIKDEIQDNTYFINETTEKEGIDFETVERIIDKYMGMEEMAIKALEVEPLTDTEQRIFLAAIGREEKVCKEVSEDIGGFDLVAVCHSIKRKVKVALWE